MEANLMIRKENPDWIINNLASGRTWQDPRQPDSIICGERQLKYVLST